MELKFAGQRDVASLQVVEHESPNTTHRYVEANLAMKEKALARLQSPDAKSRAAHTSGHCLCVSPARRYTARQEADSSENSSKKELRVE